MALQTIAFLARLPKGYRERALLNYHNYPGQEPTLVDGQDDAVDMGFTWSDTPEGEEFWSAVHDHCIEPKKYALPPLP